MEFVDFLGVDFSGAKNPGRRTWIASGSVKSDVLTIEACEPAYEFLDYDAPEDCHDALANTILDEGSGTVVGMDFPFGLPDEVVETLWSGVDSWTGFVEGFPTGEMLDPEAFQAKCRDAARETTDGNRSDLRRETDAKNGALCPYGNYVYKQSFYGIGSVLKTLVDGGATVEPMGRDANSSPVAVETYPAGTLVRMDECYATRYKGSSGLDARRRHNIDVLCTGVDRLNVSTVTGEMWRNKGGDALDAVLAAYAAYNAAAAGFPDGGNEPPVEGHIYV